jgi:hypothetical protein
MLADGEKLLEVLTQHVEKKRKDAEMKTMEQFVVTWNDENLQQSPSEVIVVFFFNVYNSENHICTHKLTKQFVFCDGTIYLKSFLIFSGKRTTES